jgi:hypothetical protein
MVIFSPGGMERFFLEAGVPTPNIDFNLPEALACASRHGWEFIS